MTTLLVIALIWWFAIRVVVVFGQLWRLANAERSPRIEVVAAAQGSGGGAARRCRVARDLGAGERPGRRCLAAVSRAEGRHGATRPCRRAAHPRRAGGESGDRGGSYCAAFSHLHHRCGLEFGGA